VVVADIVMGLGNEIGLARCDSYSLNGGPKPAMRLRRLT